MRTFLKYLSFVGLALVIAPVLAYVAGALDRGAMSTVMLVGTLIWFVSVPFWMGRTTGSRH